MRPRIVAGNWKMYTRRDTGRKLAEAVVREAGAWAGVEVVLCPPFPYLLSVGEALAGSRVSLGAQDCYDRDEGAFTGEVGPAMLADAGCRYVIVGHSERRHVLGETDAQVAAKAAAALKAGLHVILCVGETLDERQAGQVHAVLDRHVRSALGPLDRAALANVVVAYEPVWAIGTGQTATPEIAQEAHAHLRRTLGELGQADLPILYGGSVKPDNARSLFDQPDIDGGLIGGASLKADQFVPIVRAALPPG